MRACPFCGSGEQRTIPVEDSWTEQEKYRVVCNTCDAMGTPAEDEKQAMRYWDGVLAKSDAAFNRFVREEAMGGVSSPGATLNNTPGMGNAQPASSAGSNTDGPSGSGDKWGDSSLGMQTNESNINPYDKIGTMMAKKMGVEPPFKKKDSRTNTIVQTQWEELDEDQPDNTRSMDDYVNNPDDVLNNARKRKVNESKFKIDTLDSYLKASKHVPDHPLTYRKGNTPLKEETSQIHEESIRTSDSSKDIKARELLTNMGITNEYKSAKSGIKRTFITQPMKDVIDIIKRAGWEEYGRNSENTIRKYIKNDNIILTIYADGKDYPRATVTPKSEENASESIKKVVPGSIRPYLKS